MGQVVVTIAGRAYRMACGEGEESHLEALAALFDDKIKEMRAAFGEIGDMRLHVMAALTMADELVEMRRKLDALEREGADRDALATARDERLRGREARIAENLVRAAERIEHLAHSLNPTPAPLPS